MAHSSAAVAHAPRAPRRMHVPTLLAAAAAALLLSAVLAQALVFEPCTGGIDWDRVAADTTNAAAQRSYPQMAEEDDGAGGLRTVPTLLQRQAPRDDDGMFNRPGPRVVSNILVKSERRTPPRSAAQLSDLFWAFGQFVDHDISLTPTGDESTPIPLAPEDLETYSVPFMPFTRSVFEVVDGVRENPNFITGVLDGGNIYGSTPSRAAALRKNDGSGELRFSYNNQAEMLLPRNVENLENDAGPHRLRPEEQFLAGDIRSNENSLLTALHTLFLREHNRWCRRIGLNLNHRLPTDAQERDDFIYQLARRVTVGTLQKIIYYEFLPLLLGEGALPAYSGHNASETCDINTEFSSVAYRLGHSMVSPHLLVNSAGDRLPLRHFFFNPQYLADHGIEELLHFGGLHIMQELDLFIIEDLRTFLFRPGSGMVLDLAALNIQRGRDHGTADYLTMRSAYGLSPMDIVSDIPHLMDAYTDTASIDAWTAGLIEPHTDKFPGAQVGELFHTIIADQFRRLRDCDPNYFEIDAELEQYGFLDIIMERTLGDVIYDNSYAHSRYPRQSNAFVGAI